MDAASSASGTFPRSSRPARRKHPDRRRCDLRDEVTSVRRKARERTLDEARVGGTQASRERFPRNAARIEEKCRFGLQRECNRERRPQRPLFRQIVLFFLKSEMVSGMTERRPALPTFAAFLTRGNLNFANSETPRCDRLTPRGALAAI
jgi:hypothetical protein